MYSSNKSRNHIYKIFVVYSDCDGALGCYLKGHTIVTVYRREQWNETLQNHYYYCHKNKTVE